MHRERRAQGNWGTGSREGISRGRGVKQTAKVTPFIGYWKKTTETGGRGKTGGLSFVGPPETMQRYREYAGQKRWRLKQRGSRGEEKIQDAIKVSDRSVILTRKEVRERENETGIKRNSIKNGRKNQKARNVRQNC